MTAVKPEHVKAIARGLKEYADTIDLLEWLVDNELLDPAHSSSEAIRELAHSYAVRYSQFRNQIEAVIEGSKA